MENNSICTECKAKIPTLTTRLQKLNNRLHYISMGYYDTLGAGLVEVYDALRAANFNEPEIGYTLPNSEGKIHAEVGEGKWLSATWYRMPSGRYEIVAYVN